MIWPKTPLFEEVIEGAQGGGGAAAGAPGAGGAAADTTDYKAKFEQTQKDLDAAKALAIENEQSAKYWHEQAKGAPADKGAKTAEPADTTDVLELAAKGPAALKGWLKEQGFISREEAETITNAKAQTIAREAKIQADYPELQDQKSEFFQATAAEYGKLKQQGYSEIDAMQIAAERTELTMLRAGKTRGTTEDTKAKPSGRGTEEERRARASAQQGDKGRAPASRQEDDDELDANQKHIAEAMLEGLPGPDGKPMTAEQAHQAYRKKAKEGVTYAREQLMSTRKKPAAEKITDSVPTSEGKGAESIGLSMASPAIRASNAIPESKNFGDPSIKNNAPHPLEGTHINGVPFTVWAKGMPSEIVSRLSFSLTDEGLAIQNNLVARERDLPFGGEASDPAEKRILERGDALERGLDAEFAPNPMEEVLAPYREAGYAYKFLSDMCVKHLGMRGYEVVTDSKGDPVRFADLTAGRIPQRIADGRRKKYADESNERVQSMAAEYGDAVSRLRSEAKDLNLTVLEHGESRGRIVNDDTGASINIGG